MLLSELAEKLGLDYQGPPVEITGVNTLESAGPGDITFLANPKYAPLLGTTRAGAVLVDASHAGAHPACLVSSNVYMDLARTITLFAKPQGCFTGQSPLAFIHETAEVDPTATVYPFAFIGEECRIGSKAQVYPGCYVGERSQVGEDCVLYPNSVLMAETVLGKGVVVFAGAVIGADGFGYAQTGSANMKIPQIGRAVLEDGVEVGANSCVDRAALDVTLIGEGTKLDNLVQVGHNVRTGKHCLLAGMVAVGGSTRIGDNVVLGGNAGVNDNITIGDGCMVGGKAGVQRNLPPGSQVSGYYAMDYQKFLKVNARLPQLPDLFTRVRRLEKELERLAATKGEREGDGD